MLCVNLGDLFHRQPSKRMNGAPWTSWWGTQTLKQAAAASSELYGLTAMVFPSWLTVLLVFAAVVISSGLFFILLQSLILPAGIQKAVKDLPLDKELRIHDLSLQQFTPEGYIARVSLSILHSQPPVPWLRLQVRPTSPLLVFDECSKRPLAEISCFQPISVTGKSDVFVEQDRVELSLLEPVLVKETVRRVFAGGQQEIDKIAIRVELNASFDFWDGLLVLSDLKLVKRIHLGELRELKERIAAERAKDYEEVRAKYGTFTDLSEAPLALEEARVVEVTEGDFGLDGLLPKPTFTPLPMSAQIGSLIGGLDLQFASPPRLALALPVIRFKVQLNGSAIANGTLQGLILSHDSAHVPLSIQLTSVAVSKPIRGLASTAKSFLKGALTGTLNGLLFGDWGAGSSVIGITNIEVFDMDGQHVLWLESILGALDFEKDLEAFERAKDRAGKAAGNVKDAVVNLSATVMDAASRGGSKCSIM